MQVAAGTLVAAAVATLSTGPPLSPVVGELMCTAREVSLGRLANSQASWPPAVAQPSTAGSSAQARPGRAGSVPVSLTPIAVVLAAERVRVKPMRSPVLTVAASEVSDSVSVGSTSGACAWVERGAARRAWQQAAWRAQTSRGRLAPRWQQGRRQALQGDMCSATAWLTRTVMLAAPLVTAWTPSATTVARLVRPPAVTAASVTRALMVTAALAPAARLPSVHASLPALMAQPPAGASTTQAMPAAMPGSASLSRTLAAAAAPVLRTSML